MNSGTVCAGKLGSTSMIKGTRNTPAIGAISRTKWKGRLGNSAALIVFCEFTNSSVLPSEVLRQILRDQSRRNVRRTRRRLADDHLDRAGRIVERHRALPTKR